MRKRLSRLFHWIYKGIPIVKVTPSISYLSDTEKLKGKIVLIIGGTRGVGFQIAKKCLECGADIMIVGRNSDSLEKASSKLNNCKFCQFDITDIDHHSQLLEIASRLMGRIPDNLVYNASLYLHESSFSEVTPNGFDQQFSTNLRAPYFLCQRYLEQLEERQVKSANILLITSEMGLYCSDVPYGLGKATMNDFVEGLARRYVKEGIRVNALAPGVLSNEAIGITDDDLYRKYSCGQRFIMPEEIAEVATFLLSDASNCISGAVIPCNQGNHLRCDW